jgi:hypothetical protein
MAVSPDHSADTSAQSNGKPAHPDPDKFGPIHLPICQRTKSKILLGQGKYQV